MVITGRPGEWPPTEWPYKVFDLAPLTDEQTDTLITELDPDLKADERAAVAARCDGVPFYIEQVVNGVGQTGVPETLYEPLFARLRASPKVVPVVEAAAVIGREIDRGMLCSVVDLSDDEVDDVIDELEDALVLEPWGTGNWRFRHELLREVAAELAPPTVQRGLHAKVADVLSGGAGGEPDWGLVAGHYERAHRFDQAAAAYQQASNNARLRGALAEALACLTRGLVQLDLAIPGPDRDRRETALRMERGFSPRPGGLSKPGGRRGLRAVSAAGRHPPRRRAVRDLDCPGELLPRPCRPWPGGTGDRFAEAGSRGAAVGPPEDRRLVWDDGVSARRFECRHFCPRGGNRGRGHSRPAQGRRRVVAGQRAHPSGCLHLALVALVRGDLTRAEAKLARSARLAEGFGFPEGPYMRAYIRSMETWLRVEAGQLDRAALVATDMITEGERHGFDVWRATGALWQAAVGGLAALEAGDLDPSDLGAHIATITAFLDTLRAIGVNIYTTVFDAVLGRLLIAAGQPEAARERLDTGLSLAQDTGMCFYAPNCCGFAPRPATTPQRARLTSIPPSNSLAARARPYLNCALRWTISTSAVSQPLPPSPKPQSASLNYAWPELVRARSRAR